MRRAGVVGPRSCIPVSELQENCSLHVQPVVCGACRSRKVGECTLELHDLDFLNGQLQSFNLLAAAEAAARSTKHPNPVRPRASTRRSVLCTVLRVPLGSIVDGVKSLCSH